MMESMILEKVLTLDFVKVEYLFNTIKVVKKAELEYFMYYLAKASKKSCCA